MLWIFFLIVIFILLQKNAFSQISCTCIGSMYYSWLVEKQATENMKLWVNKIHLFEFLRIECFYNIICRCLIIRWFTLRIRTSDIGSQLFNVTILGTQSPALFREVPALFWAARKDYCKIYIRTSGSKELVYLNYVTCIFYR